MRFLMVLAAVFLLAVLCWQLGQAMADLARRAAVAGAALTLAVALPGAPWLPVAVLAIGLALSDRRLRHRLVLHLRWIRAARAAGLNVAMARVPRVVSTQPVPVGDELTVRLPLGTPIETLAARAARLAHAFGVRAVRVDTVVEHVGQARVTLVRRDPLNDPDAPVWPLHAAIEVSLRSSLPVAVDIDARPIELDVRHHLLLEGAGEDTFGALSLILAAAAMDPQVELRLLDGGHATLAGWHDIAARFAGAETDAARAVLHDLRDELGRRRQEALRRSAFRLEPEAGFPLILLVVHELQVYLHAPGIADLAHVLVELVTRGSHLGIAVLITGTDIPSALRAAMPMRWTLGRTRASRLVRRAQAAVNVRGYDLSEPTLVALLDRARLGRAVWSDLSASA